MEVVCCSIGNMAEVLTGDGENSKPKSIAERFRLSLKLGHELRIRISTWKSLEDVRSQTEEQKL